MLSIKPTRFPRAVTRRNHYLTAAFSNAGATISK